MKAAIIPEVRGFGRGEKCQHCTKTMKPGDMGLWQTFHVRRPESNRRSQHTIWYHRECVQKVVDNSPGSRAAIKKEYDKARPEAAALLEED